jgi:hypothetical protein
VTTPSLILLPNGQQQFFDNNGLVLAGGTVTTYLPGTNTLAQTWLDPAGAAPNANPLTLDASGRCIMWGSGLYRQVVKDATGAVLWDTETGEIPLLTQLQNGTIDACFLYDRDVVFRFDNAGLPIAPGVLGDLYTTFDGTITGWVLQADQNGALEVDLWLQQYADDSPPTNANSIVAAAFPVILAGNESASGGDQSPTGANPLTGWNTALAAKTWWRVNCNSATTITRFTLTLRVSTLAQVQFSP